MRLQLRTTTLTTTTTAVRHISSKEWLQRHKRDPYVKLAEKADLRSRSAFKLIELQERFRFIHKSTFVVDLGSSPGGWSLAAAKLLGPTGLLVSVDLLEMEPVRVSVSSGTSSGEAAAAIDTHFIRGDFTLPTTQDQVVQAGLSRRRAFADVVLSDMLQNTSGRHDLDHFRSMDLCHEALAFCDTLMRPGGTFVAKYLRGQGEAELLADAKRAFASVRAVKPKASRAESSEMYLVAQEKRGGPEHTSSHGQEAIIMDTNTSNKHGS